MQSDDSSTHDAQTLDSATADQAKEQEKANFPDTYSDTEDDDTEMKTALFDDKEELPVSVFFSILALCLCFFCLNSLSFVSRWALVFATSYRLLCFDCSPLVFIW